MSPDFLASDYINRHEMTIAMKRHAEKHARVIPVIVRPALWQHTVLGGLQALPDGATPVCEWEFPDAAWVNVVSRVRAIALGEPEEAGLAEARELNRRIRDLRVQLKAEEQRLRDLRTRHGELTVRIAGKWVLLLYGTILSGLTAALLIAPIFSPEDWSIVFVALLPGPPFAWIVARLRKKHRVPLKTLKAERAAVTEQEAASARQLQHLQDELDLALAADQ